MRGQLFLALLHAGRSRVVLIGAGAWKAELNGSGCAFEQKHERDQYEEREGYKSKRFDEAEQRRLSRRPPSPAAASCSGSARLAPVASSQAPSAGLEGLTLGTERLPVRLARPRQHRGGDGDADRAADRARQIEDAGGLVRGFLRQRLIGERRQRHEDHAHADALDDAGPDDPRRVDVEIVPSHRVAAGGGEGQADENEPARLRRA